MLKFLRNQTKPAPNERLHNAVAIENLGVYLSTPIWAPEKIFRGEIIQVE